MFDCGCTDLGYKEDMTYRELVEHKKRFGTCTDPRWVCPSVDRLLRMADAIRQREYQYNKRKRREGYKESDLRKSKRETKKVKLVDLNALRA